MIELAIRPAYVKTVDAGVGVLLAPPLRRPGIARASALLVAASCCASAATGAVIGCLVLGHPPADAFSWFGRGSMEGGQIALLGATVLLHWPFKWAIDNWW